MLHHIGQWQPNSLLEILEYLVGDLTIGLGRDAQDGLGDLLGAGYVRAAIFGTNLTIIFEFFVNSTQVPVDALGTIATGLAAERSHRGKPVIELRVITLNHLHIGEGLAWNRFAFACTPVVYST